MVLNKIDTDSVEDRERMTRKDIGLEMVRLKRARPMMDLDTNTIYASMSEMARDLGMTPQALHKKAKHNRGRIKFVYADDYPPYVDIQACETVDEYIVHYIRKYYFEFVQAMLPKMSLSYINSYNALRQSAKKPLVISVDGDAIYDVFDDPNQPIFVCNVTDIGG